MNQLQYILYSLLIVVAFYKLATIVFYLILKRKLKNGDLYTFTEVLGDNYQYRFLPSGLIRYKWSLRWITVKANFDNSSKLVCSHISLHFFTSIISEIVFAA